MIITPLAILFFHFAPDILELAGGQRNANSGCHRLYIGSSRPFMPFSVAAHGSAPAFCARMVQTGRAYEREHFSMGIPMPFSIDLHLRLRLRNKWRSGREALSPPVSAHDFRYWQST